MLFRPSSAHKDSTCTLPELELEWNDHGLGLLGALSYLVTLVLTSERALKALICTDYIDRILSMLIGSEFIDRPTVKPAAISLLLRTMYVC